MCTACYRFLIAAVAFGIGIHGFSSGWLALIIYHSFILLTLVKVRNELDFQRIYQGTSLVWLLIHLAICSLLYLGLRELAEPFVSVLIDRFKPFENLGLWFSVYFILVNPIMEEVFWREWRIDTRAGISWDDIAFGLFHLVILQPFLSWPFMAGFTVCLSLVAWFWRYCRLRFGGLLVPWVGHAMGDLLFVLIVAWLLKTG